MSALKLLIMGADGETPDEDLGDTDDGDSYVALTSATATLVAGVVTAVGSTAVGVSAIFFAWRNMKATLRQQRQMAADERLWAEQRTFYQELAEWLVDHHLAGSGDPLYQPNVLLPYTSDPGQALEAKARLFAADPIVAALLQLRDSGYSEAKVSEIFKAAMTSDKPFADHSLAKTMGWENPNDAQRELDRLRARWSDARRDLEEALRDLFQPELSRTASVPAWRGLMSPP